MAQQNIKQVRGATQGSVLFLGTNGVVSENNNKLYWDISNSALSIGTSSIFGSERLRVYGSQRIDGDLVVIGSFSVLGSASVINTQNLTIQDPIILLATTQSGAPILDSGLFINRGTGATQAFIWDESDDKFAFVQTNDSSSVIGNVSIASGAEIRSLRYNFFDTGAPANAAAPYIYAPSGGSIGINATGTIHLYTPQISSANQITLWDIGANELQFQGGSGTSYRSFRLGVNDNGNDIPTFTLHSQSSGASSFLRTGFSFSHVSNVSQNGVLERGMVIEIRDSGTYSGTAVGLTIDVTGVTNSNRVKRGIRILDGTQQNGYVLVSDSNGFGSWTSSSNIVISGGGVTGSGTTNYIPKWLSSTQLSSVSSVYDTGVNVGIGTIIPTAKLHVVGIGTSSGTYSLLVQNADGNSGFWVQDDRKSRFNGGSGDNEWVGIYQPIATGNPNVFSVYTPLGGGTGRAMLISNDGTGTDGTRAIGFMDGGATIRYLFSTGRSMMALNTSATNNFQLFSNSTGANREHIGFINGAGGGFYLDQDASTYYRMYLIGIGGSPTNVLFSSNGDSWVAYTDTQKFGVGTNTPTTKLHINATQSGGGFRLVDTSQSAGYVLTSDANGVGTWQPASSGGITVSNGLTYSGGVIKLGGILTEPTLILANGNNFTMSSTSSIIEFNRKATFAGYTHSFKLDVGESEVKLTNGNETFRLYNNSAGGLYNRVDATDGTNYSRLHNSITSTYLQSSDSISTTTLYVSPAYINMDSGVDNMTFWTASQTGGDGSLNNTMIVTDGSNSKGLVYAGDYTANFTTYSLVTKGYVDSVAGVISVSNGLTSSGGLVKLGGILTEPTLITNVNNAFTMSSTGSTIYFERVNSVAGYTNVVKLNSAASIVESTDGLGTASTLTTTLNSTSLVSSNSFDSSSVAVAPSGNTIAAYGGDGTYSTTEILTTYTQILSTDGNNVGVLYLSPSSTYIGDTNGATLFMYTSDQTIGDGSTNNRMVIDDIVNSKGVVYSGDYTANFTTYSLVTKGYVDNLSNSSTGKSVDTRTFTASLPQTLTHNLSTSDVIIQNYDSTGVQIIADTVTVLGTGSVSIEFSQNLTSVKTVIIG